MEYSQGAGNGGAGYGHSAGYGADSYGGDGGDVSGTLYLALHSHSAWMCAPCCTNFACMCNLVQCSAAWPWTLILPESVLPGAQGFEVQSVLLSMAAMHGSDDKNAMWELSI